mmetsp:Transcript_27580/g.63905  ORF Transcript_27580/g.63905 Transcript_27580/m.63905 type:complete len:304 (+) Transcript_27580:706-1617(+)
MMMPRVGLLLLQLGLLLSIHHVVQADCVCECGTVAERVCDPDACDFICQAAGDYGGDCGAGVIQNCAEEDCLAAPTPVYSCDQGRWIPAGQVKTGESLRTMSMTTTMDNGSEERSICSEVYYTHRHSSSSSTSKGAVQYSPAMEIVLENEQHDATLVVSKNHLVYKKMVHDDEVNIQPVRAQTIQVGDELLAASNNDDRKFQTVAFVQETTVPTSSLVNILTLDGSVQVGPAAGGLVISTSSYHEDLYRAVFYPVRILYQTVGKDVMGTLLASLESSPNWRAVVKSVERTVKPWLAVLTSLEN